LGYYLNLYNIWSSYEAESEGVTIAYASIYGHTRDAALYLADVLEKRGVRTAVHDLARTDLAAAVEDAFRYGKLVLASNTYNGGINPFMNDYITRLLERNYQKRTVALIDNGSWAPVAAKSMRGMFEKSKDISFAENTVTLFSAMKPENKTQLEALAEELA
ncbi:MAG: FprA family A-type flavoprotein, partial [Acetatifactor sp.]|nr:FprA family A-type flavoprotein [Acetatifactor sp.]